MTLIRYPLMAFVGGKSEVLISTWNHMLCTNVFQRVHLEILSRQIVRQGMTWDECLEIFVNLLRRPPRRPAPFGQVLRADTGGAVGRLAGASVLHAEGAGGAGVGGEAPGSTSRSLGQHIAEVSDITEGLLWRVRRSRVSYPVALWLRLKSARSSKLRLPAERSFCEQGSLATSESQLFFQVLSCPASGDLGGHAWDAHRRQPPLPDF